MSGRVVVCAQCGFEAPHNAHGLCRVCYMYTWRTGRPRPRALDGGPQRCVGCAQLLTPAVRHAHGACHACVLLWSNATRGITRRSWYPERVAAVQAQVDAKRERTA